jgi:hypothetical protein
MKMKKKTFAVIAVSTLGVLGFGYFFQSTLLARGANLVNWADGQLRRAKVAEDSQRLAGQKAVIEAAEEQEGGTKTSAMLTLAKQLIDREQQTVVQEIERMITAEKLCVDRQVLATLVPGQEELTKLLEWKQSLAKKPTGSAPKSPGTKTIRIEIPVTSKQECAIDLCFDEKGNLSAKKASKTK